VRAFELIDEGAQFRLRLARVVLCSGPVQLAARTVDAQGDYDAVLGDVDAVEKDGEQVETRTVTVEQLM